VKKEELTQLVEEHGDAVITFRSENSNKLKYNVCTLDFSTPYIQKKKNRAKETSDTVLMFCWDTDSYRLIKPMNVTSVLPLSSILRNG
jgi:uroporphyrinogen-III decarboxylase